jgi:energy-coupling factor transporter ATP-binding protein EcfA2
MTVATHLSNITDRGKFERLAIDTLRGIRPEYVNIIHGGVNAQGETISSPLDAFHKLPNDDFVLFEVTTDDTDLRKKWLHEENGDLFKAARKAEEWRQSYPLAKFTVWLCTNQRVKDDRFNKVFTDAIACASKLGLSLEFLEHSAITSYLENDPNGQWLAQKHFHIVQKRLSPEKFRAIARQNLEEYQREIFLDAEKLIGRTTEEQLLENMSLALKPILLIGASGSGKSTLACNVMNRLLANGEPVLRIKPDVAITAISAFQAIEFQLQQYEPGLIVEQSAYQIKKGTRLLVIIDDINRSAAPLRLLEHILSWQEDERVILLIPVWQYIYGQLRSHYQRPNGDRADTLYVDGYTEKEAITALHKGLAHGEQQFSTQQLEKINKELSSNPFLIEIYAAIPDLNDQNWLSRTRDPIETFIAGKLSSIQQKQSVAYFQLTGALTALSDFMLRQKSFQLSLAGWPNGTGDPTLHYLTLIGADEQLFQLTQNGQVIFRHDKIRDHLLVQRLQQLLADIPENEDVLSEPFYIQMIGRAMGSLSLSAYQQKINWFMQNLPLAVFESLHYISDPAINQFLTDEIVAWLRKDGPKQGDAIYESILQTLGQINNPGVLTICKEFTVSIPLLIAGFHNGNVLDGARFLATLNQNDFEPWTGNVRRDRLIEHFKLKFYQQRKPELIEQLQKTTSSNARKSGFILLSGYLKDKDLFCHIYQLWCTAQEELLKPAIWAMVHCFDDKYQHLLQELLTYWSALPKVERNDGIPEGLRAETEHDLGHCRYGTASDQLVDFLIQAGATARGLVRALLVQTDHPRAMNYTAGLLGDLAAELHRRKDEGFFIQSFTIYRENEKWSERHRGGRQMSAASRSSLFQIWDDPEQDEFQRHHAFRLWVAGADTVDLPHIVAAGNTIEKIAKDALQMRLVIRDKSALEVVKKRVTADDNDSAYWLVFLSFIWGPPVMEFVDELLQKHKHKVKTTFERPNSWLLGQIDDLLAYVPDADITCLLEKHWDMLQYDPSYIQLALLTGTPQCRAMVAKTFPLIGNPAIVFKYFGLKLSDGAIVNGTHFDRKPISSYVFDSLVPYLQYFEPSDIDSIAGQANDAHLETYIKTHLWRYLKANEGLHSKNWLYPSDQFLRTEFLQFIRRPQRRWQLVHWLDGLQAKSCSKERLLKLVTGILRKYPDDFDVVDGVATCIETMGTRKDLAIIDRYRNMEAYRQLYKNTRYRLWQRSLN